MKSALNGSHLYNVTARVSKSSTLRLLAKQNSSPAERLGRPFVDKHPALEVIVRRSADTWGTISFTLPIIS